MRKVSIILLFFVSVFLFTGCGCEHTWNPATCTEPKICSKCGEKSGDPLGHDYVEAVIKEASCTENGVSEFTCKVCGEKEKVNTDKTHQDNGTGYCTVCGEELHLSLDLSASEIETSKEVKFLNERKIQRNDANDGFLLLFSLQNQAEEEVEVPCIITIRIVNDDEEEIYKAKKIVGSSNFGCWSTPTHSNYLCAAIEILDSDIIKGSCSSGDIYFSVSNDYFFFTEGSLSIFNTLPVESITLELPDVPLNVKHGYGDTVFDECQITNITYENSDSGLTIYFDGKKTSDSQGDDNSDFCAFVCKVYDMDGNVVDSDSVFTEDLCVGETFKNESVYLYPNQVEYGGTYKLVVSDYC